ncbi:hypothetical protein GYH30_018603 [Glycine max]|nr:hypothetical protein GYH30_018603 [Glycine max]
MIGPTRPASPKPRPKPKSSLNPSPSPKEEHCAAPAAASGEEFFQEEEDFGAGGPEEGELEGAGGEGLLVRHAVHEDGDL